MCVGIQYIHQECRHRNTFHVLQSCPHATLTGCPQLITTHTIAITAPRLCVPCFRQKEARIDAEYDKRKAEMQQEIARVDEHFVRGRVGDEEGAVSLRGYRAECENDIVQAKAARDMSIKLFRDRQGVWGDG